MNESETAEILPGRDNPQDLELALRGYLRQAGWRSHSNRARRCGSAQYVFAKSAHDGRKIENGPR